MVLIQGLIRWVLAAT